MRQPTFLHFPFDFELSYPKFDFIKTDADQNLIYK